jgi:hypothetical protein
LEVAMLEDLIKRMRALDLLGTELEGDDWCIQVDATLQEAADVVERLHGVLQAIARQASGGARGPCN